MALLYRMGTGNGSGGDLKPYTVNFECASGYIGQTLTMTYQGTPHAGEVVDNVSGIVGSDGMLTLYPMHSGIWECSCYSSVTGTTMKKTIDLSYWGVHPTVTFEDTPNGATVTPTDDVQTWLHCANVWNKSYTTIAEVVADTTTLNTLIANENANDYLVRSITFATDICSNESAMTYIGLNDYCANKLLDDSTWLEAICDSEYIEKVLNKSVPTLTSNTGYDGGVAFCSEAITNYEAYKAFNNKTDLAERFVASVGATNIYLGYAFPKNINVKKVEILTLTDAQEAVGINAMDFEFNLAYSDNGTNYNILDELYSVPKEKAKEKSKFTIFNNNYAKYWKINFIGNTSINVAASQEFTQVYILQFYGREEA